MIKSLVATLLEKEQEIKTLNKERLPKEFYKNLVEWFCSIFPTLTVKTLKNAVSYQKRKSTVQQNDTNDGMTAEQQVMSSHDDSPISNSTKLHTQLP